MAHKAPIRNMKSWVYILSTNPCKGPCLYICVQAVLFMSIGICSQFDMYWSLFPNAYCRCSHCFPINMNGNNWLLCLAGQALANVNSLLSSAQGSTVCRISYGGRVRDQSQQDRAFPPFAKPGSSGGIANFCLTCWFPSTVINFMWPCTPAPGPVYGHQAIGGPHCSPCEYKK